MVFETRTHDKVTNEYGVRRKCSVIRDSDTGQVTNESCVLKSAVLFGTRTHDKVPNESCVSVEV